MNAAAQDPLAALRDIHLPEAVPFWPPAPGWWLAAALVVLAAAAIAVAVRRRRAGLTATALRQLDDLEQQYRQHGDASALASGLSSLLRRVALVRFPPETVASLHGVAWSDFLGRTARDEERTAQTARDLERALYAAPDDDVVADGERWISDTRHWIGRNS